MKKFNWLAVWLIGAITGSIYYLYALHVMTKNQNEIAKRYNVKTIMGFIPAFLLGCVTCGIYVIIWFYQFAVQQSSILKAMGASSDPATPLGLFLTYYFIPIYSYYVLCENHNKAVDLYSQNNFQQPFGGYQAAPQQDFQQAPQQPYGYQAPQQPYGYQAPQAPQQPYGYQAPQAPQQPYGYQAPQEAPQQPYGGYQQNYPNNNQQF